MYRPPHPSRSGSGAAGTKEEGDRSAQGKGVCVCGGGVLRSLHRSPCAPPSLASPRLPGVSLRAPPISRILTPRAELPSSLPPEGRDSSGPFFFFFSLKGFFFSSSFFISLFYLLFAQPLLASGLRNRRLRGSAPGLFLHSPRQGLCLLSEVPRGRQARCPCQMARGGSLRQSREARARKVSSPADRGLSQHPRL